MPTKAGPSGFCALPFLVAAAVALTIAAACGGAGIDKWNAATKGDPIAHDMGNGVVCYTYTEGSISCVKVK